MKPAAIESSVTPKLTMSEGYALGGVVGRGTYDQDDPATWEALVSPAVAPAQRGAGDPSPCTPTVRGSTGGVAEVPSWALRKERAPTCLEGQRQGEP